MRKLDFMGDFRGDLLMSKIYSHKRHKQKRLWLLLAALTTATVGSAGISAWSTAASAYTIPAQGGPDIANENVEFLQKMSKGVAQIAKQANQAIVFVSVYKNVQSMPSGMIDPFDFFFGPGGPGGGGRQQSPNQRQPHKEKREEGVGSGFFIDVAKGYIITNNHVVQGADEIQLKLANNETYIGKVVGRDPNTDIAVVQVKQDNFNRNGLGALHLTNSDDLSVGDFVVALGAPFGLEASLSFGVVSAMSRGSLGIANIGNFIQTDAAINPGNSGGPLIDMRGKCVGMNTAIYSRSGAYNGIGFAVPATMVRTVAEQLINTGHVRRGYLGVYLQPLDEEMITSLNLPEGVKGGGLVSRLMQGGPAAKAGLETGDVITEVNGQTIKSHSEVTTAIGLMKPGTKVNLTVYRDGKKKSLQVLISQHPEDQGEDSENAEEESAGASKQLFGMSIAPWSKSLQDRYNLESKSGVIITQTAPDSPADRAGLRAGDLILKVDGRKVDGVETLRKAAKGKSRLLVWIERAGEYYFVTLRN
jgi:serine protease Do